MNRREPGSVSAPSPYLIARVFCSDRVTLADVIARVKAYYENLELEVEVTGDAATFSREGLTIRIERMAKLRTFLPEAKALGGESAQARAKRRSCVFRVLVAADPSYAGEMLTTGRDDDPDVPGEAAGLVEFLSVTPDADFDVYDQITRHWLRDPR